MARGASCARPLMRPTRVLWTGACCLLQTTRLILCLQLQTIKPSRKVLLENDSLVLATPEPTAPKQDQGQQQQQKQQQEPEAAAKAGKRKRAAEKKAAEQQEGEDKEEEEDEQEEQEEEPAAKKSKRQGKAERKAAARWVW